jgi:hypothetical protein
LNKYGKRAMKAKESDGMDLKAMYHAVRICSEMNEILTDGVITYPRPEAQLLLDIRNGKLTNEEVANLINTLMSQGEELMKTSTLRDEPDDVALTQWVVDAQKLHVTSNLEDKMMLITKRRKREEGI